MQPGNQALTYPISSEQSAEARLAPERRQVVGGIARATRHDVGRIVVQNQDRPLLATLAQSGRR